MRLAGRSAWPYGPKKLGAIPPVVLISDQRRRWAVSDPMGKLRFNWRITEAPMRMVDFAAPFLLLLPRLARAQAELVEA